MWSLTASIEVILLRQETFATVGRKGIFAWCQCLAALFMLSYYSDFISLNTLNVTFAHVYSCCLHICIYSAPAWWINWRLILTEMWKCHIPRSILKSSLTHICLLYFLRAVCAGRGQVHCQSRQADQSVDSSHIDLPDFGPAAWLWLSNEKVTTSLILFPDHIFGSGTWDLLVYCKKKKND